MLNAKSIFGAICIISSAMAMKEWIVSSRWKKKKSKALAACSLKMARNYNFTITWRILEFQLVLIKSSIKTFIIVARKKGENQFPRSPILMNKNFIFQKWEYKIHKPKTSKNFWSKLQIFLIIKFNKCTLMTVAWTIINLLKF